jgi:hypothetical protein
VSGNSFSQIDEESPAPAIATMLCCLLLLQYFPAVPIIIWHADGLSVRLSSAETQLKSFSLMEE